MKLLLALWPWLRGGLAFVGAAALLSLAWFYTSLWLEPQPPRQEIAVSPVARDLAAEVSPSLVAAAREYQPTFLQHAAETGMIVRFAAGQIYPVIIKDLPRGTEIGCDVLLSRFDKMTIGDLAGLVVRHATEKGESVHPSVAAAAAASGNPSWRFP